MNETGVRKCHSVTARTARVFRRDVIGRYHWLRFEPRLKVILLSCAVGVLGPVVAFAGAAGHFHGSAVNSTQPTGSVASQTVDECLAVPPPLVPPWDIGCLLERPVGTVADGPPSGSDDRGGGGDTGGGGVVLTLFGEDPCRSASSKTNWG